MLIMSVLVMGGNDVGRLSWIASIIQAHSMGFFLLLLGASGKLKITSVAQLLGITVPHWTWWCHNPLGSTSPFHYCMV